MKLPRIPRLDRLEVERPGAPPGRRDWIIVGLFGLLVLAEVAFYLVDDSSTAEWPLLALIPATVTLAMVPFRRIRPVATVLIALFVGAVIEASTNVIGIADERAAGEGLAVVMLIYAVCRWAPLRSALAALSIAALAVFAANMTSDNSVLENSGFVIPWAVFALAGIVMRYRAQVAAQQEVQIRLEERQDLARELHDTVAHHVSAIAVQAQAAQFVAANDPAGAVAAMKAVEDIANTTIDEMRRMVGILRSDDDRARAVTGSIAELAEPGGSPRVSVDDGGLGPDALPSPIAAALFRIAQESITNARRHSRAVTFVDVTVRRTDDSATVTVINDGTPTNRNTGGGYGLIGMHERVEALNGTLDVGPRSTSGWSVLATIPVRRARDVASIDSAPIDLETERNP